MEAILRSIKALIVGQKAADFKARASISLAVFKETIDSLTSLNDEALAHKKRHEEIIVESTNEIKSVDETVAKNKRVIDKINDILA